MGKVGLDYFSVDCQPDQKSLLFVLEFGAKGLGILIALKMEIFGRYGYYSEWNDDVALEFGHRYGVGSGVVCEVVSACLRRGIFHREMFDRYGILTSVEIQEEYARATARRTFQKIDGRYLLIPMPANWVDVNGNGENVDRNAENVDRSTQRRVEESRVDSFNHSFAREEDNNAGTAAEGGTMRREAIGGIGQGLVMLSEEQIADLLERLSREEFDRYVSIVAGCERSGKKYRAKTHYEAILDMARADRALKRKI